MSLNSLIDRLFSRLRAQPIGDDAQEDQEDQSDHKVKLMDLPDDALLSVLGYLDALDLLKLRLQCRRLRDLALHPHLWRCLKVSSIHPGVSRAVLSLAPCVGMMNLDEELLQYPRMSRVSVSTDCAVHVLDMSDMTDAFTLHLPAFRRQMLLGQLKGLHVVIGSNNRSMFTAALEAVERCSLEELHMTWYDARLHHLEAARVPRPVALPQPPAQPSLKKLYFHARPMQLTFLTFLLHSHAATLQEVNVYFCDPPPPMELLSALPRLRKLSTRLPDDMRPLLQCPALTSLRMRSDSTYLCPALQKAADFVRDSTLLQDLRLDFVSSSVPMELVKAMSSPGHAALRKLRLHHPWWREGDERHVAAALPYLPGLRVLELTAPLNAQKNLLLSAITPSSAPSLRELWLLLYEQTCLHAWLHGEGTELLQKNPAMHLITHNARCDSVAPCEHCRAGCHPAFSDRSATVVGVTSHNESAHCGMLHLSRILNLNHQPQTCIWVIV